jgi:hypothetical protein
LREAWLARETALEFQYKKPGVNNIIKGFLGGFFKEIALLLNKILKAVSECLF